MAVPVAGAAWLARVAAENGPIYAAIVRALEAAIAEGELQPGDRLPAQRQVAEQVGVDLTTVTRAYAAARALGLLEGTVGRGTFVRLRAEEDDAGLIDLSMNLPPPPEGLSLGELLRETIDRVLARTDPARLMAYHPGFGTLGQRRAGAAWLSPCLGERAPECVLVSPGAQAALAATLSTLCRAGDAVVAEPLTYPGFKAVAAQLGLRALACPVDQHGPVPEALQEICERERPTAVYLTPTMQNPTARTTPPARRRALARIIAAAGAWLVEDDPYSRLLEAPPPAIATLLPSRWVYIGTLSKTLSPGLRVAYVVCATSGDAARIAAGLRSIALTPAPIMAAAATTWIREGRADALLAAVRAEARARARSDGGAAARRRGRGREPARLAAAACRSVGRPHPRRRTGARAGAGHPGGVPDRARRRAWHAHLAGRTRPSRGARRRAGPPGGDAGGPGRPTPGRLTPPQQRPNVDKRGRLGPTLLVSGAREVGHERHARSDYIRHGGDSAGGHGGRRSACPADPHAPAAQVRRGPPARPDRRLQRPAPLAVRALRPRCAHAAHRRQVRRADPVLPPAMTGASPERPAPFSGVCGRRFGSRALHPWA